VKALLDAHIWIWSQVEPERLGQPLSRLLAAGDMELWLSPISN
jgi:PIN domain nuclease of toxin-antitoxin system